jgi:hypothetical protein
MKVLYHISFTKIYLFISLDCAHVTVQIHCLCTTDGVGAFIAVPPMVGEPP